MASSGGYRPTVQGRPPAGKRGQVRSAPLKLLVIGAGPAGLAAARVFADTGCQVEVVERRNHLGGNCFDEHDAHGVLVHRYGPHYFRTNSKALADWLTRFSEWIPGRYLVRASVGSRRGRSQEHLSSVGISPIST